MIKIKNLENAFLVSGILFFISACVFVDNEDKFISRIIIMLISFGFYAILKKMDYLIKK